MTIWKFAVDLGQQGSIFDAPLGAQWLSVETEMIVSETDMVGTEKAVVWALVDPTAEPQRRQIACAQTGESLDALATTMQNNGYRGIYSGAYIGTVRTSTGLVWHLFDCGSPNA